jgi:glutamate-5-semialdehyde dehydrogenase
MNADSDPLASMAAIMDPIGRAARRAAAQLALTDNDRRNRALRAAAEAIRGQRQDILAANARDMQSGAERGLSRSMLDRLMLDADRVEAMAAGIEAVAGLPDPVGKIIAEWERPNGLQIQRVTVPLGVMRAART